MVKNLNKRGSISLILIIAATVVALGGIGTVVYLKANKKVTVMFDNQAVKVKSGNKVEKPKNPEKEGYEFVGWYVGETEYDFNTEVTEDIKLTAKYEIKSYTVKFVTNCDTVLEDVIVKYNEKVEKPADLEKTNAEFLGWKLDGTDYDFESPVKGDITLTAEWNQKFVVKFDSDGGSKVSEQLIEANGKATAPKDPTKSGNKFLGWKLDGKDFSFDTVIDKDITLKASWEKTATELTASKVCSMAKSYVKAKGKAGEYYYDKCKIVKQNGEWYRAYIAGNRADSGETEEAALLIIHYDGFTGEIETFDTSSGYIDGMQPGVEHGLW